MSDLKPCPFCGGKAVMRMWLPEGVESGDVGCVECDAEMSSIEIWNTRADGWVSVDTAPKEDKSYLCDIGGIDPVVLVFSDGHWYFEGHRGVKKDGWVRFYHPLPPKQA